MQISPQTRFSFLPTRTLCRACHKAPKGFVCCKCRRSFQPDRGRGPGDSTTTVSLLLLSASTPSVSPVVPFPPHFALLAGTPRSVSTSEPAVSDKHKISVRSPGHARGWHRGATECPCCGCSPNTHVCEEDKSYRKGSPVYEPWVGGMKRR